MSYVWDLIICGRGSAAAYYLTTLDRSLFPNILVIGAPDPWGNERGYNPTAKSDPVNFINHTWQMIAHLGDVFPDFDTSLVDRRAFADANSRLIDQCSTSVVVASITGIEELEELAVSIRIHPSGRLRLFRVSTDQPAQYLGKKIVVATGAGPHRTPDEVKGLNAPNAIMDMDTFARKAGTFSNAAKQTVVI